MSAYWFVLCAVVAVGLAAANNSEFEASGWWAPTSIAHTSVDYSRSRVELMANGSKIAYTSTFGSYFRPWDANATLPEPGWIRLDAANPEYGFHAVAFANDAERLLLIAVRGTDLNASGLSGQADICADHYLWDAPPPHVGSGVSSSAPPAFCAKFNATTLDYFTAARHFANRVASQRPGYSVMYTGHSLGAGLGAMLALWPSSPDCPMPPSAGAVVFSAPDYLFALQHRTSKLNFSAALPSSVVNRVVVLADAWDPIHAAAFAKNYSGMVGALGVWRNASGPPLLECEICIEIEHVKSITSLSCMACMMQRHIFSHYIDVVQRDPPPTWTLGIDRCHGVAGCAPFADAPPTC